jgi:predicted small lipoprotein YifL
MFCLYNPTREIMKVINQLLVIVLAVSTLAACDEMGKGPSKPASSDTPPALQK